MRAAAVLEADVGASEVFGILCGLVGEIVVPLERG